MARKKGWFNPNPTLCNHAGCHVAAQSKQDKARYLQDKTRPVKRFKSRVKNVEGNH